jgi:hypothetical protein
VLSSLISSQALYLPIAEEDAEASPLKFHPLEEVTALEGSNTE